MTTLTINLSPALRDELSSSGVYAYAAYFNSGGPGPHGVELVSGGVVISGGSVPLELTPPYVGGKVYFIIQSVASGGSSDLFATSGDTILPSGGIIQQESDLSFTGGHNSNGSGTSADVQNYRFDSFELTLTPGINDVGNLTSVNGFGIPMGLTVDYNNNTSATRGYNLDASTLVSQLAASGAFVEGYSGAGLLSGFRALASPAEAAEGRPERQLL